MRYLFVWDRDRQAFCFVSLAIVYRLPYSTVHYTVRLAMKRITIKDTVSLYNYSTQ